MAVVLAKQKGKFWLVLGEAGFGRENLKAGSSDLLFYLVETGKSLGFVCLSFKIFSWQEIY
jgi:hypothetical protein